MASGAQAAVERLLNERPSEADRASWCQGCNNQYEAAQRYNGDMACTFGVCLRSAPGDRSVMYLEAFTRAVIELQLELNDSEYSGAHLTVDGKLGDHTLSAMKRHVSEAGAKNTGYDGVDHFFEKYKVASIAVPWDAGSLACPPCLVDDEPPPPPPAKVQEAGGAGLIIAAVGIGVLYWIYARQARR